MLSAIGVGLGYILRSIKNPAAAGLPDEAIRVAFLQIVTALKIIARGFDGVFSRVREAWSASQSDANNIATIERDIGKWGTGNWNRLTGVILPNSQSWVIGAIHRWADSTFLRQTWLQSKQWLTVQSHSQTAYTFWQTNHTWLHGFRYTGWPAMQKWRIKYANPQLKMLWQLNPHVYPLESVILNNAANYLHSKAGATDLHNLTGLIVDESPTLWRHVEAAILAWLNTEVGSGG